jgi:hypothetical protein
MLALSVETHNLRITLMFVGGLKSNSYPTAIFSPSGTQRFLVFRLPIPHLLRHMDKASFNQGTQFVQGFSAG